MNIVPGRSRINESYRRSSRHHVISLDAKINKASTDLRDEMAAGFKVLGEKVEGHEDRIWFLEGKVA